MSTVTDTSSDKQLQENLKRAASAVSESKTLLITAGAGMGVDSGLPDFRSPQGFWKAYPMYESMKINYMEIGTPKTFFEDPSFAWGFYGHRRQLYLEAEPHRGFYILRDWIESGGKASYVITSNVDGQFQKAGFAQEQVVEAHGSIHHLQCQEPCSPDIWEAVEPVEVDLGTMRATRMPECIYCGNIARPNVLMFNDWHCIPTRMNAQERAFDEFIAACPKPIVVVEIGAGRTIPMIRWRSEELGRKRGATIVRINPQESSIDHPHIPISTGGAQGLALIADELS